MSRKRQQGRYCWSCGRIRPNKRFSRKGHARCLCRECAGLGKEELAYRQAVVDMERLFTWEGFLRRKGRAEFRKYLNHDNERVRAYARQLEIADAANRAEDRVECELYEVLSELGAEGYQAPLGEEPSSDVSFDDDWDIPF